MPSSTSTTSDGSAAIVNTVKDQTPGASPFTTNEKIGLGVAVVGLVGALWYAGSRGGVSLHPARDPRRHRRHGRRGR